MVRSGREVALRVTLATASVALGVYAVEAAMTVTARDAVAEPCHSVEAPRLCTAALREGLPFDTRSIREVIADLAAEGVTAWPAIVPRKVAAANEDGGAAPTRPLAGISDALVVYCNRGEHVVYRSDEHGFRNPPGLHRQGRVQVALVGDSFTQGYCVENGETIADVLRRAFPGTLSLGLDDSGPLRELATLREYAEPLRPPAVVWLYYEGNDLDDLDRENRKASLRRYLEPGFTQDLRGRQSGIDAALGRAARARANERREEEAAAAGEGGRGGWLSGIARLTRVRGRIGEAIEGPRHRDPSPLGPVLAAARDAVASWNGTLYFAYLPAWQRFGARRGAHPERDEVLAIASGLGLPTIDVTESFEAHGDPLSLFPLRRPGHYTAEGYALVARAIADELRDRAAPARS